MATIKSIINSINAAPKDLSVFTNPGLIGVTKMLSSVLAQIESGNPSYVGVDQFLKRGQRFGALAVELGWPPPWHMPVRTINEITTRHAAGELTNADVENLFIELYNADVIAEFLRRWERYNWLAERMPILREAVLNHSDGRYYSAVCTLLPQIEGMIGDELGRKPKPKEDAKLLFRASRLGTVAKDFYVNVVLESFEWSEGAPMPDLSRHAILHGRSTRYGSKKHSLKLVIILDILIESIRESRTRGCELESE